MYKLNKADWLGLFICSFIGTGTLVAWIAWAVRYNEALRALL